MSKATSGELVKNLQHPNGWWRDTAQRLLVERKDPEGEDGGAGLITLRLRTATPYALLPYELVSMFIVSKRAAQKAEAKDFDSGRAMVGSGPFRFGR